MSHGLSQQLQARLYINANNYLKDGCLKDVAGSFQCCSVTG